VKQAIAILQREAGLPETGKHRYFHVHTQAMQQSQIDVLGVL
jgi:hypothetical protein